MIPGDGGSGHTRRGVVRSHTVIASDAGAPERERPHVDMATLLSVDPTAPVTGLAVQARRVAALLVPGVLSVADVAAHLELPGAVVRAVVADLIVSGHVTAASPLTSPAQLHDRDFLERVLDGLQRL